MSDDFIDDEAEVPGEEGRRKDGKPFKQGNTREDGSYAVGKCRTPSEHRFAKGDGRPRGKRPKGSKNLDTIWRTELARKRTFDGRTRENLEWVVEGTTRRAIAKSDRAADTVLAKAAELERKKDRQIAISDREAIDAWIAQHVARTGGEVTDDAEMPLDGCDEAASQGDHDVDL